MAHAVQIEKIREHRVERMTAKLKSHRIALRAAQAKLDSQASDIMVHEAQSVAIKQDIRSDGIIETGVLLEKLNIVSKQSQKRAVLLTHRAGLLDQILDIENNVSRSSADLKRLMSSNEKWKIILQNIT